MPLYVYDNREPCTCLEDKDVSILQVFDVDDGYRIKPSRLVVAIYIPPFVTKVKMICGNELDFTWSRETCEMQWGYMDLHYFGSVRSIQDYRETDLPDPKDISPNSIHTPIHTDCLKCSAFSYDFDVYESTFTYAGLEYRRYDIYEIFQEYVVYTPVPTSIILRYNNTPF